LASRLSSISAKPGRSPTWSALLVATPILMLREAFGGSSA
jgi:hypothetical protein